MQFETQNYHANPAKSKQLFIIVGYPDGWKAWLIEK
jgi:hypothetical protein